MTFSQKLKDLRIEKGVSQDELAVATGLSHGCIAMLEVGKRLPTAPTLTAIADFFEVSTDYLLGRTDELGNIAFTAPTLPAREQQLLADFRSLAPALQEMLLATIETWKGSKANAGTGGKRA